MKISNLSIIATMLIVGCKTIDPVPVGHQQIAAKGSSNYSSSIYAGPSDASKWLSKNAVLHFDKISKFSKELSPNINLYLDAYGTIYPESGYGDFVLDNSEKQLSRYGGDISWALGESDSYLCRTAEGGDLQAMCSASAQDVEIIQDALWASKAEEILEQFDKTDVRDKDLVVLIHGFNVPDSTDDYNEVIRRLDERDNNVKERVYLQVHWDGGGKDSGIRALTKWRRAQYTGPVVGFELRRLFNSINDISKKRGIESPSIRVITHSSGAFLVGATFGNPSSALPALKDGNDIYRDFKTHLIDQSGRWRVPAIKDLTLGMVAPATGSWTFTGFVKNSPSSHDLQNFAVATDSEGAGWFDFKRGLQIKDARIVTTQKRSDVAVGKYGFSPAFLGATHLGALKSSNCEVQQWAKKRGLHTDVLALDFTPTPNDVIRERPKRKTSHSWRYYINQDASNEFIDFFFDQAPATEFKIDC